MSGHADQNGLIRWVTSFTPKPKRVFIVHGEDHVCDTFASILETNYNIPTGVPYSGAIFDLATNLWVRQPAGIPVPEKAPSSGKSVSAAFARLLAAGQRLLSVINKNSGLANKDMAKFTDQINSICDKWDR